MEIRGVSKCKLCQSNQTDKLIKLTLQTNMIQCPVYSQAEKCKIEHVLQLLEWPTAGVFRLE